MKKLIIAPVGEGIDKLFVGIRDFPTEKIVLLTPKERYAAAMQAKQQLERFKIPVDIIEVSGSWEDTFKTVAEVKELEKGKEILINVATGDSITKCAATSAAFVNGIKAFDIIGDETMMLPVLKFSYYNLLTERKMSILRLLQKQTYYSMNELSKATGMSLPLVSYHINGNLKSEGLKSLGVVDTHENKGRLTIQLSLLGKMLVKGYIK